MATYAHTRMGRPVPHHAQTEAAEAARAALRELPAMRIITIEGESHVTRQPLTRREVEAAYVHPEPERPAVEAALDRSIGYSMPITFGERAEATGADVKVTVARGTTPPKWHVNAPDNKTNPGPPVDPSQYHGEVVDSVVVWAQKKQDNLFGWTRIRAEWHNGRIHEVTVNGAKSSLKAALEALGS